MATLDEHLFAFMLKSAARYGVLALAIEVELTMSTRATGEANCSKCVSQSTE